MSTEFPALPGLPQANPTEEVYAEFQFAYQFLNERLFGSELPPSLITLQRKGKRVLGYFSGDRFGHRVAHHRTAHEIALNPIHFRDSAPERVLATLVHEMCHVWQHHRGTAPSEGYHDKEWAKKMVAIGLHPSSTGREGGRRTGKRMSHYPVMDGAFAHAVQELITLDAFKLHWHDRLGEPLHSHEGGSSGLQQLTGPGGTGTGQAHKTRNKGGKRTKWICPVCNDPCWGKPSLQVGCIKCKVALVTEAQLATMTRPAPFTWPERPTPSPQEEAGRIVEGFHGVGSIVPDPEEPFSS